MFYRSRKVNTKINIPNGRWCMQQGPALPDPGRDEDLPGTPPGPDHTPVHGSGNALPGDAARSLDNPVQYEPPDWEPVITRPDWMTEEEREAWLDALAGQDEPFDPEEYPDPEDCAPPPGEDELTAGEIAGIREVTGAEARAAADAARVEEGHLGA
jgi:hypothetical protein